MLRISMNKYMRIYIRISECGIEGGPGGGEAGSPERCSALLIQRKRVGDSIPNTVAWAHRALEGDVSGSIPNAGA